MKRNWQNINKKRERERKKNTHNARLGTNHPPQSRIEYFTFHLSFLLQKLVCTKYFRLPHVENHSYTSMIIYKRERGRDIERKSQRQNLKYFPKVVESRSWREMQKCEKCCFPSTTWAICQKSIFYKINQFFIK